MRFNQLIDLFIKNCFYNPIIIQDWRHCGSSLHDYCQPCQREEASDVPGVARIDSGRQPEYDSKPAWLTSYLIFTFIIQVAQSKRLNHMSASSSSQVSTLRLKRKACYDEDEEVQQVRKGIRDMSV